jgi:hypothetical protein
MELLCENNYHWLKRMIGFGNIRVVPIEFIGIRRNADFLVTILNPPYRGEQKVAVEVENDYDFDVDKMLQQIKKDQPCPTIAIIPKENERDAWLFRENLIKVWLWSVKRRWKCGYCHSFSTTTSKSPPRECPNESCKKKGNFVFEGIEHNNEPFVEADNNPSETWGEIQEKLRPRGGIDFL